MSGFWNCSKEPRVSLDREIRIVRITMALGRYRSGRLFFDYRNVAPAMIRTRSDLCSIAKTNIVESLI